MLLAEMKKDSKPAEVPYPLQLHQYSGQVGAIKPMARNKNNPEIDAPVPPSQKKFSF
jgi:hypothetical protein